MLAIQPISKPAPFHLASLQMLNCKPVMVTTELIVIVREHKPG